MCAVQLAGAFCIFACCCVILPAPIYLCRLGPQQPDPCRASAPRGASPAWAGCCVVAFVFGSRFVPRCRVSLAISGFEGPPACGAPPCPHDVLSPAATLPQVARLFDEELGPPLQLDEINVGAYCISAER